MCPDRQILSVYSDNELPSPWKEKMEQHLSECPDCGEQMELYRKLSVSIKESSSGMEAARDRVWQALSRLENVRVYQKPRNNFWHRSFSVPLPAAVAALLVLAFAAAFLLRPSFINAPSDSVIADIGPDTQGIIPVSDMSGILQYLEHQESMGEIVIIRLPESRHFVTSGEPSIIRAADYSRRTLSQ